MGISHDTLFEAAPVRRARMVRREIVGEQLGDRLEPALAPNLLVVPQNYFLASLPHADLH
jgi:hypothetical protein